MKNTYVIDGDVTKIFIPYHDQILEALITTSDLEMVSKAMSWSARYDHGTDQFYVQGYLPKDHQFQIKTRVVSLHRLVMNFPEGLVVHHVNHKPLDNRRDNLQAITRAENSSLQPEKRREHINLYTNRSLVSWAIPTDVKNTLISLAAGKKMNLNDYVVSLLEDHVRPKKTDYIRTYYKVNRK